MKKSSKPLPHHLTDFLDWLDIEKGLASKSQENYARFLKKFTDWLNANGLQNLKPHELSPEHIWKYRVYLSRSSKHPLKKSTQNYYLIALRALLNYFTERDILALPTEKIKLSKDKREREIHFLTLEQLKKLFASPDISEASGLRDRAILETFFSTGLRISELVSLKCTQVKPKLNAKEAEISIIGKGGKIRTVYLSERTLEWLKKYLETRKDNSDVLFPLTPRAIQKMTKKYAVIAGIPLFTTPHVMRHTFATDLLEQGVDLRTIQEFLGHKSITATQIYTHVTSKKLREVHKRFHSGRNLS
ncbi:MAG: Tyrosine recombinase xerD [Candidatus Adlerbacteria bacterium GW2011_GWC1_50_9]|uniref:Tyrosine recombinase xerD n=1 Tax=Candidatus Adlerbacteria bacterium GW2011_GWC1_50_9 TaxID=1618608 RepID=A0A0G1WQE3_9BACT|nr:MAG: Tyrosine recombinase xerD [Candidatus Adlerbacteria bacterium GW2011_GWC1_50_9]